METTKVSHEPSKARLNVFKYSMVTSKRILVATNRVMVATNIVLVAFNVVMESTL